ncbi:hypothetical protein Leryth_001284 [Lithospermum erythrorhizon]|nr:hypothetical protein Leryth_001284 [Lithospermum erythrorhizon]
MNRATRMLSSIRFYSTHLIRTPPPLPLPQAEVSALKHFYGRMVKDNAMDEVAKEVVGMVDMEDWCVVVEARLRELKFEVSDNFVLRVMKEMRGKGCPLKALSFFGLVGERLGFEHNGVTYNGLLRVICQEESIGEFWDMFREMKSVGYEMDLDTYIKISRHFQKYKMLKEAVELYEHMMDGPYKPSFHECNRLLPQIAGTVSPDMDLVFRVVKKFEAAGYSLSKSIYDGIHRCLTTVGKFEEAEKVIETMKNAGFEPDNITYSQLVFGLCKSGRLEEASKVLDIMEEQECIPDLKTWTILIQGHCRAKEVDKALFLFAKMIQKNIDADGDLLDVLLNGFLSQGKVLGAYQLLIEMVTRAHIKPWQATYKNLIQKLLGERKLEESLNLLTQMKKLNYPPFVEPFDEYIAKFGTTEDAREFLNALSVKDYPSISAYQRIFESFFSEGRHSDAKNLLYKCPHHVRKHKAISSLFGSAEGQPFKSGLPKSKLVVEEIAT